MNIIPDKFMKKIKKNAPEQLNITSTQMYIFSMLVIFPLFYTDGMFHLFLDKRNFFLFFSIVYICAILPTALSALYDWWKSPNILKNLDMLFALILMSALVISTVFSLNTYNTFFKMTSRTVSGLCFLFGMLTLFAIRQYRKIGKFLLWTWIAGSSFLYLFGILCACGINVMHIQDGLDASQLPVYLTPLSNTNYNSCYVCLMLPPAMTMYMISKEKLNKILCGINIYLGFLFTFFIKTESSIITIIFGLILLGYFALEKNSWSERHIQITGIYLGAKLTVRLLLIVYPGNLYPFHGLGLLLLNNTLLISEILCFVFFFILWNWKPNVIREKLVSARKAFVIIVALLIVCCIICVIYVNINAANIATDSFWYKLVLTDETFSGRGYIWIRSATVLKEEPIVRKLFGNGLNSFKTLMRLTRMLPAGDAFADPHNEFLQMALDMGILGLIGYFGLQFSSLVRGLKNWKKDEFQIITIITLSVYMVQALANEYSIYTLPLLFIFLGLVNGKFQTSDKK